MGKNGSNPFIMASRWARLQPNFRRNFGFNRKIGQSRNRLYVSRVSRWRNLETRDTHNLAIVAFVSRLPYFSGTSEISLKIKCRWRHQKVKWPTNNFAAGFFALALAYFLFSRFTKQKFRRNFCFVRRSDGYFPPSRNDMNL